MMICHLWNSGDDGKAYAEEGELLVTRRALNTQIKVDETDHQLVQHIERIVSSYFLLPLHNAHFA